MDEDKRKINNERPNWVSAVQIFSEISTWIIVPIVLALFGGRALDAHYGTKPVIFLCLAGLAFIFTCIGIVKVVKNYMKKLKETEKKN